MSRTVRERLIAVACGALALTTLSCDGRAPTTGASEVPVAMPTALLTSRAVNREATSVSMTAGRVPVETRRDGDGAWTARLDVPAGEVVPVTVTWFERIGTVALPLHTQSREVGPIYADGTLEIDPDGYDSASLDRDGDGVSNLDEREAGTDPLRAPGAEDLALTDDQRNDETPLASPPGADAVIDTVVLPMDPAADPPVLDGLYDTPTWPSNVSARDVDGRLLFVNRLIEDRTPDTVEELQGYQWLAMHDFDYLYLYVVFERGNGRTDEVTPYRDSGASFHDDDMLNLYFDVDHDRADAPGGADDHYLVIPFVRPGADETGQPEAFSPNPGSEALVAGLDFHACVCREQDESAWEIRIPTAELGVGFDEPFGFEVRIDQDIDGGPGEGSWGWASPMPDEREAGFRHGSPAFYGTIVLSSMR